MSQRKLGKEPVADENPAVKSFFLMTGFNFFKFVFDTLSLTVMGIDIDSFYLPCSNYPVYSMKTFFFQFWNILLKDSYSCYFLFLKFLLHIYIFSLSILHALKQLGSLNQFFDFQLLYCSIYKFNSQYLSCSTNALAL